MRTADWEREQARQRVAAHIVGAVPGVSLPRALAAMDEAKVRHIALHAVDRHLAEHPDALVAGDPASPIGLVRLARTLHTAGFTTVRLIGCARCGATDGELKSQSPTGRICRRCVRQTAERPLRPDRPVGRLAPGRPGLRHLRREQPGHLRRLRGLRPACAPVPAPAQRRGAVSTLRTHQGLPVHGLRPGRARSRPERPDRLSQRHVLTVPAGLALGRRRPSIEVALVLPGWWLALGPAARENTAGNGIANAPVN